MTTRNPDDGSETTRYPGGVVRTTYPDSSTITRYPNGVVKFNDPDGSERTRYPNGVVKGSNADGSEIFTKDANGKVTTIFPNSGVTITQYPNGAGFIDFPDGSSIYRQSNGELSVHRPPGVSYSAADWEFKGVLGCLQNPSDCVTWWTIGNVN